MDLYMEKHGMNFLKNEPMRACSDLGNFRVNTGFFNWISGRNGREYFLEFSPRRSTGELCIDTTFTDSDSGKSYRDLILEKEVHGRHYPYTSAGILSAVNEISAESYDNIVWTLTATVRIPKGKNITPATLLHGWAKDLGISSRNHYDVTVYRINDTDYVYDRYRVDPIGRSEEEVTILLREWKP